MRPSDRSKVTHRGFSSSTCLVTPSTIGVFAGKVDAERTNDKKSPSGIIESTVVTTAGAPARRSATRRNVAYEDGVLRTTISSSKSLVCCSSHWQQSSLASLITIDNLRMLAARKRLRV